MAQWYYTSGNQEIGPVSDEQIRQLATTGKLSPDDEVWREGMANWARAGDVPGLLSDRPLEPPPPPPSTARPVASTPARPLPPIETATLGRWLGLPLLFAGLLLVLMSRGCDSLGDRQVERARGLAQSAPLEFDYYYQTREQRLENEKLRIRENNELSSSDEKRLVEIDEQLVELREERDKERAELVRGEWRDLQYTAETAEANDRTWGYWRELAFLFGTLVLTAGLLCITFFSGGPERWVALALLAIIIFSVYGGVWVGGIGRLGG